MSPPLDEIKNRVTSLEQRASALDQQDAKLAQDKAAKSDLDAIEKRTSSIESKIGIAVAIAIVLGLGGAGIGGLLINAQNKISEVSKQADSASESVKNLGKQINETKDKAVTEVDTAAKKAVGQVNDAAANLSRSIEQSLVSRLKVKFYQFCTGEYDAPCSPYPRFDPRDNPADKVAQKYCGPKVNYTLMKYREINGGCCGYGWYNLTCTSFE